MKSNIHETTMVKIFHLEKQIIKMQLKVSCFIIHIKYLSVLKDVHNDVVLKLNCLKYYICASPAFLVSCILY